MRRSDPRWSESGSEKERTERERKKCSQLMRDPVELILATLSQLSCSIMRSKEGGAEKRNEMKEEK